MDRNYCGEVLEKVWELDGEGQWGKKGASLIFLTIKIK